MLRCALVVVPHYAPLAFVQPCSGRLPSSPAPLRPAIVSDPACAQLRPSLFLHPRALSVRWHPQTQSSSRSRHPSPSSPSSVPPSSRSFSPRRLAHFLSCARTHAEPAAEEECTRCDLVCVHRRPLAASDRLTFPHLIAQTRGCRPSCRCAVPAGSGSETLLTTY